MGMFTREQSGLLSAAHQWTLNVRVAGIATQNTFEVENYMTPQKPETEQRQDVDTSNFGYRPDPNARWVTIKITTNKCPMCGGKP